MSNPMSLILFGETGMGKTEFAKALMSERRIKFILIRDKEGLKEFRKNFHHGIIFDDLNVSSLSREELIHMMDTENGSQVRILYGYMFIPEGVLRIFTTNYPGQLLGNDPALKRRSLSCEIKDIKKLKSNRKRGRPLGSKDKQPRKRRKDARN